MITSDEPLVMVAEAPLPPVRVDCIIGGRLPGNRPERGRVSDADITLLWWIGRPTPLPSVVPVVVVDAEW